MSRLGLIALRLAKYGPQRRTCNQMLPDILKVQVNFNQGIH